MQLTEKETTVIKDLQTQERLCVEKYRFYEESANDPELKQIFHKIGDDEQEHFDFLGQLLKGDVRITNHVQLTTPETIPMPNDTTSFCVPTPLVQKN